MDFANRLISWYLQNRRDLPWRHTTDPYFIWLSEIMLQQTRVLQGLPYYLAFTDAFPTVHDLANANEEQVLKLWQGLGYYSRARNLHATARAVSAELGGRFPDSYSGLLQLKGIGDYTAAAVASFAYNEPVAVVDGNVFRFLARYFDIESDIALPKTRKEFASLASQLMPTDKAAVFNQAIMEFGALQCVPRNPDCARCPFNDSCLALQRAKVAKLPVKIKKTRIAKRFLNYLVFEDEERNTLMQKRHGKGIWQNLYEFPMVETDARADLAVVSDAVATNAISAITELASAHTTHKLSHQHLDIRFWKIEVGSRLDEGIGIDALRRLPVPIVLHHFIEDHFGRTAQAGAPCDDKRSGRGLR